ncbi:MAG TPA: alpha/beta hydrolase [Mycobacteriales bacterium]|nr:alpha/beta hydrolase [Mycobacteriales bacterium]
MSLATRHAVRESGRPDGQPMLFAHGFGCDQNMWRLLTPRFEADYRVIVFDHAGAGGSDPSAYSPERHASLSGYAQDVLGLVRELDLHDVVFVGHSVSAMIGALAAIEESERFAHLIMVGPSPRYVDDEGYVGGFSERDVEDLLTSLDSNYLGWSSAMAPVIMGREDRPELGEELTESFCRIDPDIARRFARATFLSDNRADLPHVQVPTLVLQCAHDVIAPTSVGEYVAEHIPDATLVMLEATGHCPNLSAPEETGEAIAGYLRARAPVAG